MNHEQQKDDRKAIRLNKFLSNAGICSRRKADDIIKEGRVSINGKIVKEMGLKVYADDVVKLDDKSIKRKEGLVYYLMNKPKGVVTTVTDEKDRKTVMDLLPGKINERIYPVGRLDRDTTGLLLITNDGELTHHLTHPSHKIEKIYRAETDRPISKNDLKSMAEGIELEDGLAAFDEIVFLDDHRTAIGIKIHEGRNRLIRRTLEALQYEVKKLDRVKMGPLTKYKLPRGAVRALSPKEVRALRSGIPGKRRG